MKINDLLKGLRNDNRLSALTKSRAEVAMKNGSDWFKLRVVEEAREDIRKYNKEQLNQTLGVPS